MNEPVNDTIPFPTLTGAMALLGPLLLLTSTVVFLVTTGEINHGAVGGAVSAWAAFALMFAFIGIALKLVPRAPRGSVVVLAAAVPGVMTGLAYSVQAIDLDVTGNAFMTSELSGPEAFGQLAFDPWGLGLPIALGATAWLIWRTATFPRPAAIPLALNAVLFIPSREIDVPGLPLISDVLLVAAFAPISVVLLRSRAPLDRPTES